MPIKPNMVTLDLKSVANQNYVRITRVNPQFEYADGQRTEKQIGYSYQVLCEANSFEKLLVKVSDTTPVITPEQLADSQEPVYATFSDFVARFYWSNHSKNWELSCKASKAQIVKQPKG